MLSLLFGKGQQQSAPVGRQSVLDKPILDRGIFEVCFDSVVGMAEACGRGISKGTDSLMAGISAAIPDISLSVPSFSQAASNEISGPAPKLGLNAQKAQNIVRDTSEFACTMNDVVVPTVGGKSAQQGFGIQQ